MIVVFARREASLDVDAGCAKLPPWRGLSTCSIAGKSMMPIGPF